MAYNKGGPYEREMAKLISLWASEGKEDDWYWRSSQSGGRATVRARKGKGTKGHCGDLCATCQEGEFLTKVFTIECKNGYPKAVASSLLGITERSGLSEFGSFIVQAREAAKRAGSKYWLLIHHHKYKENLIYLPGTAYFKIRRLLGLEKSLYFDECQKIQLRVKLKNDNHPSVIVGLLLDDFLRLVPTQVIRKLL